MSFEVVSLALWIALDRSDAQPVHLASEKVVGQFSTKTAQHPLFQTIILHLRNRRRRYELCLIHSINDED